MSTQAHVLAMALPARDEAFRDIFLEHYTLVYGLALRTTGEPATAEDVTQETFLRLYEHWPRLRIRVSLASWLARVALNLAYTHVRQTRRGQRLAEKAEALEAGTPAPSAEEAAQRDGDRRSVALALGRLKPGDRSVLLLRHSGLSYQEVADATGIRPVSVGKTLQRAEARFKRAYIELNGKDDE